MTYAFTFDASACTGCKACQIACKDKNNLPTGVLWRRVFEVSGGTWTQQGNAWENSIFAYHLSIACNHCVHPKCAGVCPTDAFVQREDGIVYIDESKCMGCGYCAWACPYSVPQYNPELGHMTKCNFCLDELDQGKPPACVVACPMRVLDFAVISDQLSVTSYQSPVISDEYQGLWERPATEHPFPLPAFSRTQPHLAIKPHAGMVNGLEKNIYNQEEVKPQRHSNFDELPLVIFTLCAQMAAGMAVIALFSQPSTFNLSSIGLLLGLGGFVSFLHLGAKRNAWRALNHLKKSWLSREILAFGLFGLSWLISFTEHWLLNTDQRSLNTEHWLLNTEPWSLITALLGLGLVYSMAQVYRIKAAPAWNTWRTEAAFFLSAIILGGLALPAFGAMSGVGVGSGASLPLGLAGIGLIAALGLSLSGREKAHKTARRLRVAATGLALAGLAAGCIFPAASGLLIPFVFLAAILGEFLGRWLFYSSRNPDL